MKAPGSIASEGAGDVEATEAGRPRPRRQGRRGDRAARPGQKRRERAGARSGWRWRGSPWTIASTGRRARRETEREEARRRGHRRALREREGCHLASDMPATVIRAKSRRFRRTLSHCSRTVVATKASADSARTKAEELAQTGLEPEDPVDLIGHQRVRTRPRPAGRAARAHRRRSGRICAGSASALPFSAGGASSVRLEGQPAAEALQRAGSDQARTAGPVRFWQDAGTPRA